MLIDISPPISPSLAVWPGDTPVSREVLLDMKAGASVTLSTLRATVHLGSHVDAPSHYGAHAPTMHERPLDIYVGECQVMRANTQRGERVTPAMLADEVTSARVLIKTGTFADPNNWNDDFAALSPELVDFLHAKGVRLVGIDTPSVDLIDSKDLPAHKRFLANDMSILEGVVLKDVEPGRYELIALPLALVGFDASPVRAVLRPLIS